MALLEIKDLHATVGDREIEGHRPHRRSGEVHAIMGPTAPARALGAVLAGANCTT